MQKSFWWWQRSDRYVISLSPNLHTPFPPFSPSLISRTVSVDVKHHIYLLIYLNTLQIGERFHWQASSGGSKFCQYLFCFGLYQGADQRLAHDVFDTLTTPVGLVHDVTHTDCWAQSGKTHVPIFTTFKCHFYFVIERTCRRIKIKEIPFCYVMTKFERLINAEQHMCNIEKDIGGRGCEKFGLKN